MASNAVKLPKDRESLARVIRDHVIREETRMAMLSAKWDLFTYYIAGYRRFTGFDAYGGRVSSFFLDEQGRWQSQLQDVLVAINRVKGVLVGLNVRPSVRREGDALMAIREAASARILADYGTSSAHLDEVKDDFLDLYIRLGFAGIHSRIDDSATVGLTADHEVVHPREIIPFPSLGLDRTKTCGRVRRRYIDINELASEYGNSIKSHVNMMDVVRRRIGDSNPDERREVSSGPSSFGAQRVGKPSSDEYLAVKFVQLWMNGPRDTCSRYVSSSRDHIFEDVDYEARGVEMYHSLNYQRFVDNGTFHGAGLCDLLYSVARELEHTIKSLTSNFRDLSRYPITLIPAGLISERKVMKEDGTDLKFVTYQPESSLAANTRSIRPITISPHMLGTEIPGRTAAFLRDIVDAYNPASDLVRDKGRIDSLPGLQFLDEQAKQPLTTAISGVGRVFSAAHRYTTQQIAARLVESPRPIPVSRLDLGLIGAVINFEDSTVEFSRNPLPNLSRLSFSIQSLTTSGESLKKQEAMFLVERGVSDRNSLILYAMREGIQLAMYLDGEEAAYRTAIFNILALFGDGESNQPIWISPHTERPDLQLRVLDAFLGAPEFRVARPDIINDFFTYRESLLAGMRQFVPQQIPDPLSIIDQRGQSALSQPA